MEKVIVYGVGAYFEKNRREIEKNYHIIGYCDIDERKLEKLDKDDKKNSSQNDI